MARSRSETISYEVLTLSGVRYAVLREGVLLGLCRASGATAAAADQAGRAGPWVEAESLDARALAARLVMRRRALAVSQAELARQAGVRVETLNRIERGKVMPDLATLRKLVIALRELEARA